jgi:hypothetical protein
MADEVVIDRRFRGPPASANGGYTCGILAEALGTASAEVNLRRPPPLDVALAVERDAGSARLLDGDELVAEARGLEALDLELEEPPPLHIAEEADARSPFYDDHAFPSCFVCGPAREPGDGLRIYPGALDGRRAMACAWTPDAEFAGADGRIANRIVWAALDCPSGIAAHHFAADETTMVLARLRGRLERPIEAARPHVVVGWMLDRDGRKHRSATAIFDAAGEPRAWAEALWIELREEGG